MGAKGGIIGGFIAAETGVAHELKGERFGRHKGDRAVGAMQAAHQLCHQLLETLLGLHVLRAVLQKPVAAVILFELGEKVEYLLHVHASPPYPFTAVRKLLLRTSWCTQSDTCCVER